VPGSGPGPGFLDKDHVVVRLGGSLEVEFTAPADVGVEYSKPRAKSRPLRWFGRYRGLGGRRKARVILGTSVLDEKRLMHLREARRYRCRTRFGTETDGLMKLAVR
jgi:hypothetical protein